MGTRYDLAIIGGGIVGLATAFRLLERRPGLRLVVLDKEPEVARHQSGHNTGVIHAGIYYKPGSRKAVLCREGKAALERFADEHGIPRLRNGKLIVALDETELGRLADLKERGLANGVDGLEEVGPERIRELEPHAAGLRGLHSPGTGSIDFRLVCVALADELRKRGGELLLGHEVTAIQDAGDTRLLKVRRTSGAAEEPAGTGEGASRPDGEVAARDVIACAGLHSDRVAAMTGPAGELRIIPFRGDYYTFKPAARPLVRAHIYPVPDPAFPFLGVHFSTRADGEVWAGPNAVLAFAREGYKVTDLSLRDLAGIFGFRGFRRLAGRYLRTGLAEMGRDLYKPAFVKALRRYLPELSGSDLVFGPSGVRAQVLDSEGTLVDDFAFSEAPHIIHVRNAPSPAATASLAIGRVLAEKAIERFALR